MSINSSYNLNRSRCDNYNSPSKHIQVGGSLIISKNFDFSKYINQAKNQLFSEKKEKNQNQSISIDSCSSPLNNRYQYDSIFSSPKSKNRLLKNWKKQNLLDRSNSNNKTITTQETFKTSGYPITGVNIVKNSQTIDIKKFPVKTENNIIKESNNKNNNLNRFSLFKNNSNNTPFKSGEIFNISKIVQNIKKSVDLSRKDKSLKTLLNGNFAYDESHLKEVFEPNKLINNYYTHVQTSLNQDDNNLKSFVDKNKQISINNVLINLLKNEKTKIYENQSIREKKILDNTKTLENSENEFYEYKHVQKTACRKIENLLTAIHSKNRRLLEEERNAKAELKISEDERVKILEMIDELRIIAKFVHKVLGDNNNIFKNKILPTDYSIPPDYEQITKNLFIRFKSFLSDEENKDMLSNEILNEPEVMIRKFHEVEDSIIRGLNLEGNYDSEIQSIKKDSEKIEKDISERCVDLELEYEKLKEIYKNDLEELNDIINRQNPNDQDEDCNELIRDLYTEVAEIFKSSVNNKYYGINVNKISPGECASETQRIIVENEIKLYNLMFGLEKIEENDPRMFETILEERKSVNKEIKLNMYKKKLEEKQAKIIVKNEDQSQRMVFLSRKTEPPFHLPKKVVKVKNDKKLIEMQENQQLMSYD